MLKNGSHDHSGHQAPWGWGRGAAIGDSPERPPSAGAGPLTVVLTTLAACGPSSVFFARSWGPGLSLLRRLGNAPSPGGRPGCTRVPFGRAAIGAGGWRGGAGLC